jgi:hypothetical protein
MLMRSDYPTEYVNAVREMVAANVASYAALGLPEENDLSVAEYEKLALAFLDELESRFPTH